MTDTPTEALTEALWEYVAYLNDVEHEAFPQHPANAAKRLSAILAEQGAAVVTTDSLRLRLGMHEPVTNSRGYLVKCGCGDWRLGVLGEPSYNEHVAAAIIQAAKEAEPPTPKPTCAECGHIHAFPNHCFVGVEWNSVRTITKRCDCAAKEAERE